MTQREERIIQLVAVCVKKDKNPNKTAFADFIIRICSAAYGCDKRTAKSYLSTLISGWQANHWLNLVKENLYLEPEEREAWIKLHLPT